MNWFWDRYPQLLIGVGLSMMILGPTYGLYLMSREKADLAAQNVELRVARNRRDRALSGMVLPGFTPDRLERATRTAEVHGVPWPLVNAVFVCENGGDYLEFGIQDLPTSLMQTWQDPKDHQYAGLQRLLTQEAFDLLLRDPALRARFVSEFVDRHGPVKPEEYKDRMYTLLNGYLDAGKPTTKPLLPKRERRRAGHERAHGKRKEARR